MELWFKACLSDLTLAWRGKWSHKREMRRGAVWAGTGTVLSHKEGAGNYGMANIHPSLSLLPLKRIWNPPWLRVASLPLSASSCRPELLPNPFICYLFLGDFGVGCCAHFCSPGLTASRDAARRHAIQILLLRARRWCRVRYSPQVRRREGQRGTSGQVMLWWMNRNLGLWRPAFLFQARAVIYQLCDHGQITSFP